MRRIDTYLYLKEKRPFLLEEWDSSKNGDVFIFKKSNSSKVWWKCSVCGNQWQATIANRVRNRNCPRCSKSATSFVEQFFLVALRQLLGETKVLSRNKSLIGKELDIYIPDLNFALEPGDFHFHRKNVSLDRFKRIACKNKNVRLITILWNCNKNYKAKNVWRFKKDLSYNTKVLKKILQEILRELNIPSERLDALDFNSILESANRFSSRMTNEDFLKRLKEVRDDVNPLEDYQSMLVHIKVECKICNNQWKIFPSNLLRNRQCPVCSKRNNQKKVICLETKIVYNGKREAERILGHSIVCYSSLEKPVSVSGQHFMLFDDYKKLSLKDIERIVNFKPHRPPSSKRKRVSKFDKNGILLETYNSISEASLTTGISIGNISSVCNGKRHFAGNFIWKFS